MAQRVIHVNESDYGDLLSVIDSLEDIIMNGRRCGYENIEPLTDKQKKYLEELTKLMSDALIL